MRVGTSPQSQHKANWRNFMVGQDLSCLSHGCLREGSPETWMQYWENAQYERPDSTSGNSGGAVRVPRREGRHIARCYESSPCAPVLRATVRARYTLNWCFSARNSTLVQEAE